MPTEITIVCQSCGKQVKTTGTGDFAQFICAECQNKRNVGAYKEEIALLQAKGAQIAGDETTRINFLNNLIAQAEA